MELVHLEMSLRNRSNKNVGTIEIVRVAFVVQVPCGKQWNSFFRATSSRHANLVFFFLSYLCFLMLIWNVHRSNMTTGGSCDLRVPICSCKGGLWFVRPLYELQKLELLQLEKLELWKSKLFCLGHLIQELLSAADLHKQWKNYISWKISLKVLYDFYELLFSFAWLPITNECLKLLDWIQFPTSH